MADPYAEYRQLFCNVSYSVYDSGRLPHRRTEPFAVARAIELQATEVMNFRALVIPLLIFISLYANPSGADERACLAFISPAKHVRLFLAKALQPNEDQILWRRSHEIVRGAIQYMADHQDMDQAGKARFWTGVARHLDKHGVQAFASQRFEGTDGSIVFQGVGTGALLVIKSDGDVWRGTLSPALDEVAAPRPMWRAEYTYLKRIEPSARQTQALPLTGS